MSSLWQLNLEQQSELNQSFDENERWPIRQEPLEGSEGVPVMLSICRAVTCQGVVCKYRPLPFFRGSSRQKPGLKNLLAMMTSDQVPFNLDLACCVVIALHATIMLKYLEHDTEMHWTRAACCTAALCADVLFALGGGPEGLALSCLGSNAVLVQYTCPRSDGVSSFKY